MAEMTHLAQLGTGNIHGLTVYLFDCIIIDRKIYELDIWGILLFIGQKSLSVNYSHWCPHVIIYT